MKHIKKLFLALFVLGVLIILTACDFLEGNVIITFDFDGGEYHGSKDDLNIKTERGYLTSSIPIPSKENHTFEYYTILSDGEVLNIDDIKNRKFKKHSTLVASWEELKNDSNSLKKVLKKAEINLNEYEFNDDLESLIENKQKAQNILNTKDDETNILEIINKINELISKLVKKSSEVSDINSFDKTKNIIKDYTNNLISNSKLYNDNTLPLFSSKALGNSYSLTWEVVIGNSELNNDLLTLKNTSAEKISNKICATLKDNHNEKSENLEFYIDIEPNVSIDDILAKYENLIKENLKNIKDSYNDGDVISILNEDDKKDDIKITLSSIDNDITITGYNAIIKATPKKRKAILKIELDFLNIKKTLTYKITINAKKASEKNNLDQAQEKLEQDMRTKTNKTYLDNEKLSVITSYNKVKISWKTDDKNTKIDNSNIVFGSTKEERIITLKAILAFENKEKELSFNIKVAPIITNDEDIIKEALKRINTDTREKSAKSYNHKDKLMLLSSSDLPSGVSIIWESNDNNIIINNNNLVFNSTKEPRNISLIAKITYKTQERTLSFTFKVNKLPPSPAEVINETEQYIKNDMKTKTNKTYNDNDTLKIITAHNNVNIIWSTNDSNTKINDNNVKITSLKEEREITLICELSYKGETRTFDFKINIRGKETSGKPVSPSFDPLPGQPNFFKNNLNIGNYYHKLDFDANGEETFKQLREIVNDGYNACSYSDIRYYYKKMEVWPGNWNYIRGMYDLREIEDWEGGTVNREHIWPQSYLGTTKVSANERSIRSDFHNLRCCDQKTNASRGNEIFVDMPGGGSGTPRKGQHYNRGWFPGDRGWFPGDLDKGDLARIMVYMVIKWPELSLGTNKGSKTYSAPHRFGDIRVFKKWHHEDPVDVFEVNRQEHIYVKQKNRNPFVDYPYLFDKVFDYLIKKNNITISSAERTGNILNNNLLRIELFKNYFEYKKYYL